MDNLGIGKLIITDAARDAIHVAVAPVIAGEKLYPGQHVGVKDGRGIAGGTYLGIVDPFLSVPVYPEQRFWLFLYPGSITSLRHHWEHPEFSDEPMGRDPSGSMAWLRGYASDLELDYDDMMEGADAWIVSGAYMNRGSLLVGQETPEEFWDHYEAVTGERVPIARRGSFFTCSC